MLVKKYIISILMLSVMLIFTSCGAGESGISKNEYDKIEIGMKYSQVKEIVGGDGKLISEKTNKTGLNESLITRTYEFQGEQNGKATLIFVYEKSDSNTERYYVLTEKECTELD